MSAAAHIIESPRGAKQVPLLGRCKGCKRGIRIVDAVPVEVGRQGEWSGRAMFRMADGAMLPAVAHSWSDGVTVRCAGCSRRVWLKPVLGRVNPAKGCDGRCMSATGHSCECACGGANHGCNHG